jgi:hypothetical protein
MPAANATLAPQSVVPTNSLAAIAKGRARLCRAAPNPSSGALREWNTGLCALYAQWTFCPRRLLSGVQLRWAHRL